MYTLTFSPTAGYELPFDLLTQFCHRHGKAAPTRTHLLGPICLLRASDLSIAEHIWLESQPEVTRHERCISIHFAGSDTEDEAELIASHLSWCAHAGEDVASVVLPEALAFLSCRECSS